MTENQPTPAVESVLARIDVLERRINARLLEIEDKVDSHALEIAEARGGLKAARWLFTALVSVAGLLGLSHMFKSS